MEKRIVKSVRQSDSFFSREFGIKFCQNLGT